MIFNLQQFMEDWPAPEGYYAVLGECTNCGHRTSINLVKKVERPARVRCEECECFTMLTGPKEKE